MPGKPDSALTDSARTALYKYGAPLDRTRHMDSVVGGDAGDAQARPLFKGDRVRKRNGLGSGDDHLLGSRPERAIALRSVAPNALAYPRLRDVPPNPIDDPGPVAVRNHAGVGHPHPERVLTLLHVAGVDAGDGHPDAHLTRSRLRIWQITDLNDLSGRALPFVPGGFHLREDRLKAKCERRNQRYA